MKRSLSPLRAKSQMAGSRRAATKPNPQLLLTWYDKNRRILPWRAAPGIAADPYHVWLSEIMLQQTTVGAVGPYFRKFLTRWPTLRHLAKAKQDEVLQMWAGLGYYRRARGLYECAQQLKQKYNYQFPQSEKELAELPGFGPYTVAAVRSIAFDQSANVVDGNVERVMARLFNVQTPLPKAKTELKALAATLLPQSRHGDYAQALMDLGATICTPQSPKCGLCPWNKSCLSRQQGTAERLPRRVRAKAKPIRRAIAFFLTRPDGSIFMQKRAPKGLLASMLEIPSSPWEEKPMPSIAAVKTHAPIKDNWQLSSGIVRHAFTHFELEIAVATASTSKPLAGRWMPLNKLADEAIPSVMHKIIRHALKQGTRTK